jgi:hypothetical protein
MESRKDVGNSKEGESLCSNNDRMVNPGRKTPSNSPANTLIQENIPIEGRRTKTLSLILGNKLTMIKQEA